MRGCPPSVVMPHPTDTNGQTSFVIPLRTSPAATIRPLSRRHIAIFLRPAVKSRPARRHFAECPRKSRHAPCCRPLAVPSGMRGCPRPLSCLTQLSQTVRPLLSFRFARLLPQQSARFRSDILQYFSAPAVKSRPTRRHFAECPRKSRRAPCRRPPPFWH